jgi:sec-independent protein translocase protein TatA
MADEEEDKKRRYDEQRRSDPKQLPRDQDPIDVTPRPTETAAPRPRRDDEAR